MPVPPLRPDGTLPPGTHDATLDEVFAAFPGRTPRRQALNDALATFVAIAGRLAISRDMAVDGSYTTSSADSGDLDLVVLTPGLYQQEAEQRFGGAGADLVLLDVQFAHDTLNFEGWVDFFSTQRDMTPKGIIRLLI